MALISNTTAIFITYKVFSYDIHSNGKHGMVIVNSIVAILCHYLFSFYTIFFLAFQIF